MNLDNYQGYLRPHLHTIIRMAKDGARPDEISEKLGAVRDGYKAGNQMIRYVLKRISQPPRLDGIRTSRPTISPVWPTPENFRKAVAYRSWDERTDGKEMVFDSYRKRWVIIDLRARNVGRPIDMGGPRDQWLEQGPWDAV